MSTIQATNLKSALSTTNNAVMTAGGDFTNAAGISYMGGSKNLLINGAMQVHQRSASVAGITDGAFRTADRWFQQVFNAGTWTSTIENDAPTGSGLAKSLKLTCSASASISGLANVRIWQKLEGQDVQRIAKGTASAQKLTLSFWVKSNVTGTYIAGIDDLTNTRYIAKSYTISSANTWEKKSITFDEDQSGVLLNNSSESLMPQFWLAAASSFSGGSSLLNTWGTSGGNNMAVGQTNLAASANNYLQLTGIQLEIGPVATSFEFEPYETTLRKCQRYYFISGTGYTNAWTGIGGASSTVAVQGRFPTTMRAAPIISIKRPSDQANNAHRRERSVISATSYTNDEAFTTLSVPDVGVNGFPYYATSGGTAPTVGAFYMFICEANAEL